MRIRFGDGTGSEAYRTCTQCGGDCEPEPFDSGDDQGIRIAFICPQHGIHSVVDPFDRQQKT